MVAAALGIGLLLQQFLDISSIGLVFLTAVLTASISYGLWPSLFACLLAVLAYNFFFIPPLYTFTIGDPENVVALCNLAARVRAEALSARQRAKMTEDLYLFSRKLAGSVVLDDLLWATAYQIALMLKVRVVLLLPEDSTISVRAGYPPEDTLDEADLAAAKWTWETGRAAGRAADTLPGAKRLFLPMRTASGVIGVVGLDNDRPGPILTTDQRRLFDALVDQAALAIERINFAKDIDKTRIAAETERLRSALLTSISHDLRTPLASILGSATTLKSYRKTLDEKSQEELIGMIQDEAERLNRFIANLLDMTKLESGTIAPHSERVDAGDVIGSALERAKKVLASHNVEVNLASDLPALRADPVLLEQVLFNILDNAGKYTPAATTIRVDGQQQGSAIVLQITDEGPGIPTEDIERIFDKFYRAQAGDRKRAGTGLGLAICRGFVEAMGGAITAANRRDRTGAIFTISLPVSADATAFHESVA
jgi:two-component system sensor histidine kinase KdpD